MAKKIIMQVSYPGLGESPYKTVAFSPTMTVKDACAICATKGGLKDKIDEYGLCIKDSGTWLKEEDSLDKYPLQNCAGLEYKPTPKKTTVTYENDERKMEIDFSLAGSDVLAFILEAFGEPKSNEFGFSILSESDGTKGPSIDYTKPLIDQANPSDTKIIVKKKSKIGGIFRRTDSHKGKRESTFVQSGVISRKIFGVPLAQVAHPAKYGGLPAVVAKTIEFLEETALQLEGIFRISGNQSEVLALKKSFDEGNDVNVRECSSPHVAAGLLKLYLRDLPEPLFTFGLYDIFIALNNTVTNETVRVTYFKVIVDTLPTPNRMLLFRLLPFLANVVKYADINKMAIHNVATVFGPNILRSPDTSAIAMIQGTASVNAITCDMIHNYSELIEPPGECDFCSVAITLFKYEGKSESEVSFNEGEVVFVIKEDTAGWWEGEVHGDYGFFPANYVKSVLTLQKEIEKPVIKKKPAPAPVKKETPVAAVTTDSSNKSTTPVTNINTTQQPAKSKQGPQSRGDRKPRQSGAGGSKQKFMAELKDLKTMAVKESTNNSKLEETVSNLLKEVENIKNNTTNSNANSSGTSSNLESTVSSLQEEVKLLENSNSNLQSQLSTVTSELDGIKKQLSALKTEEIALKRDLKIVQFKCDKLGK